MGRRHRRVEPDGPAVLGGGPDVPEDGLLPPFSSLNPSSRSIIRLGHLTSRIAPRDACRAVIFAPPRWHLKGGSPAQAATREA